jgi:hypothetical protein
LISECQIRASPKGRFGRSNAQVGSTQQLAAAASNGEENNPLGELCALCDFASFEKMRPVATS